MDKSFWSTVSKIVRPEDGLCVSLSGDINRFLVAAEDTDGSWAQWEAIVPPGGGPRLHVHSREKEGFFLLEGEVTLHVADESTVVRAGTCVTLPIGIPHGFHNHSDKLARILITVVPAGLERMFMEAGTRIEAGSTVAPARSREELERVREAAPRYGIRFVEDRH